MADDGRIACVTRWVRKRLFLGLFCGAFLSWAGAFFVQEWVRPAGFDGVFNPIYFFDWAPSFFYAFGFALLFLSFRSRTPVQNAILVAMGAVGYEFLQAVIPGRTVDWMDIAASIAAIPLAIGIFKIATTHR